MSLCTTGWVDSNWNSNGALLTDRNHLRGLNISVLSTTHAEGIAKTPRLRSFGAKNAPQDDMAGWKRVRIYRDAETGAFTGVNQL